MNSLSWGDNDRRLGPFLFARDRSFKQLALVLDSGKGGGNRLRFSFYGFTLIAALPRIIKPYVGWVDLSGRDWATPGDDGRKGYEEVDERCYGVTVFEGHLTFKLGRQTMDSSTTQSWGCFLPWTNWRYIRKSWYGLDGEHLRTDWESKDREQRFAAFQVQREFEEAMPKAKFTFKDFDGEELSPHDRRFRAWVGIQLRQPTRGTRLSLVGRRGRAAALGMSNPVITAPSEQVGNLSSEQGSVVAPAKRVTPKDP